MSHDVCEYREGECRLCAKEAEIFAMRAIRSQRGRWMVVQEDSTAYRHTKLSAARKHVNLCREAGIAAWIRHWARDRVVYVHLGFEVSDVRWTPQTWRPL